MELEKMDNEEEHYEFCFHENTAEDARRWFREVVFPDAYSPMFHQKLNLRVLGPGEDMKIPEEVELNKLPDTIYIWARSEKAFWRSIDMRRNKVDDHAAGIHDMEWTKATKVDNTTYKTSKHQFTIKYNMLLGVLAVPDDPTERTRLEQPCLAAVVDLDHV